LSRLVGREITVRYGDWRPGDQPVYISDSSEALYPITFPLPCARREVLCGQDGLWI